jgi:hypothetical protein
MIISPPAPRRGVEERRWPLPENCMRTAEHRYSLSVGRTLVGLGLLAGVALLVASLAAVPGCQDMDPNSAYTSRTPYRTDVRTVFVEMFKSEAFQRGIENEMHRALCQRIELNTPYKVVTDRRTADSIVYGTIGSVAESPLSRQRELGRPIENRVVVFADVSWKNLRTGQAIMDKQRVRVTGDYAVLLAAGRDSAIKEAANEMALRIVEAMEEPW